MYSLNIKSPTITGGLNPLALKQSGIYKGIILTAFSEPRDDGKKVARILFEADEVYSTKHKEFLKLVEPKMADLWLLLTNKKGNLTSAYTHLKELCNISDICYLDKELVDVPIFSATNGSFKNEPREQFSDLIKKQIIIDLRAKRKMGLRFDYLFYRIVRFYHAQTLQTSQELDENIKAKDFYERAIL